MNRDSSEQGTPLVLLVNDEEWTSRSIESILAPEGFAVVRAYTGGQGLELAARMRLDLVLVDLRLPDITGIDLSRHLREIPTIRPSTPIVLFSSGPIRRSDRLAALEAGVWAVLEPPMDAQELLALLAPFVAAKRDADRALELSFVDPLTGFYNVQGLIRRVTEMSGDTMRSRRPLACVVLGPGEPEASSEGGLQSARGNDPAIRHTDPEVTRTLGSAILSVTRLSDAVGRVGENDFVIVSPGTGADGALRLAERVISAIDEAGSQNEGLRRIELKAGFYVISGGEPETLVPEELLRRATAALRGAQSSDGAAEGAGHSRIRAYRSN